MPPRLQKSGLALSTLSDGLQTKPTVCLMRCRAIIHSTWLQARWMKRWRSTMLEHSPFIPRGKTGVQNAKSRRDGRGKTHFSGQLSTKYCSSWVGDTLSAAPAPQCQNPADVAGYTMFHSDRAVVRPVANQSCGKNRENRQRVHLPHSFFWGGGPNWRIGQTSPFFEFFFPFLFWKTEKNGVRQICY